MNAVKGKEEAKIMAQMITHVMKCPHCGTYVFKDEYETIGICINCGWQWITGSIRKKES
jgi:ribosomal protein L37AE/L43A